MSIQRQPGGTFSVTNGRVAALIAFAYQLQNFQLVGVPDWARTDRYDILAKAGRDLPPTPLAGEAPEMLMLRALLADRFKLAVHRETRETPIYALVVARSDGRLGPALRRSETDCAALMKAAGDRRAAPAPPTAARPLVCGMRNMNGDVIASALPMSAFVSLISTELGRVVVDRTGLSGEWDFDLTFAPDRTRPAAADATPDPNRPTLFTALQEQLGLKLEATSGPVDVLVIDRIEHLTED